MARQLHGHALVVGMALGAGAWVVLLLVATARGRTIAPFSLAYNVPITLAFGALAFDILVRVATLGRARFIREHAGLAAAWAIGAVVLALRLFAKSIDVSGHMSWSLLMGVQCVVESAPRWFTVFVSAIVIEVVFLKAFVLGGHSGVWGALAGLVLGGILIIDVRRRWPLGARAS
jgi:hypothetical protein